MANKLAIKIDMAPFTVKLAVFGDGTYFTHRENKVAMKFINLNSNCPYYLNPGFVCPLSANRDSGLFVIN